MGETSHVRVLHVIQNLNYGGMERLMADLVPLSDKRHFGIHVLTLEYLGRFSREMEGHATLHLGPRMSALSLLRPAALARCIRGIAPDVVHTHSGVWYKTARAARLAGVPRVIHTEHGCQSEDLLSRLLDRLAARLTDAVVVVSEPLRGHLSGRLALPPTRMTVIPNGVDTHTFRPRSPSGVLWGEFGIHPEQPIIGSIGRLEPVKGYDVLIQAFALVRERMPEEDPVLVIAGEGSAHCGLEALVARLGLCGKVFLLGWRDDASDLYAHFACFAAASWSEGTSVSLLEAMASGLAPAVTSVGGNRDVLGPDLSECAVPPGNPGALADQIVSLVRGGRGREVGTAARRRVEQHFDIRGTVRRYERLYVASGEDKPAR